MAYLAQKGIGSSGRVAMPPCWMTFPSKKGERRKQQSRNSLVEIR